MLKNSYLLQNKKWWEKKVKEDSIFTRPWLDLNADQLKRFVEGKTKKIPRHLDDIYPIHVLQNIKDKNVLLLASGGGQQSAIFGLLGAKVTVVDFSMSQLKNDKKAAKHYGYKIKTIEGDISNLSLLINNSFDLVYQAPSMGYVPDVQSVYSEVWRVLKSGGLYRADAQNPQSRFTDKSSWNGKGYLISEMYSTKTKQRSKEKKVIEFRHTLDEIFNGLIKCGFEIEGVEEMPSNLYQKGTPKPGSWEHYLLYIPGLFTILARKK